MRLQSAFKNSVFGVVSQAILIVCGIVLQRVMVMTLGNEVIGLNSVFSNIVSILSLSEMGIASAIVYNLYKPIAKGDTITIIKLMTLFKKAYRVIALSVTVLGLVILPFVHIFVDDSSLANQLGFIRIVFVLFVAKTALSYLFSYKRSLLTADQKSYILIATELVSRIISMGISFVVLYTTGSIIWYLVVAIVVNVLENFFVSFVVDKKYPYLSQSKEYDKLDKAVAKTVFSDVKNIFVGKVSGTILTSTDYLIISSFLGVVQAGFYYNYNLIINSILMVITKIQTGIQSSIGDMFVEGNNVKNHDILRQLTFMFFWVTAISGVCLFCLLDTFVTGMWLTPEHRLPIAVVAVCVVVFYWLCVRGPLWSMLAVSGLFSQDKYISIIGTVTNLVVSLVLVIVMRNVWGMGMLGVFIGTLVSQLLQVVLKTNLFFRVYLKMSAKRYIRDLIEYFLIFVVSAAVAYLICSFIKIESMVFVEFLLKAIVAFVIPNAMILVFYGKGKRFKDTKNLMRFYLRKGKKSDINTDCNV